MAVLASWPDTRKVCAAAFADLGETGSRTPDDFTGRLPYIRFRVVGGSDDRITDQPRVAADVFAGTPDQAWEIAKTVRQRFLAGRIATVHGRIDSARTEVGPQEAPWPGQSGQPGAILTDPAVSLVTAIYRLGLRR